MRNEIPFQITWLSSGILTHSQGNVDTQSRKYNQKHSDDYKQFDKPDNYKQFNKPRKINICDFQH